MIWLSGFGRILARLYGPLGAFYPQTSEAAEFAAQPSSSSLLSPNSDFHCDCQVVADAFGKPPRGRLHPNRPYAGLVMQSDAFSQGFFRSFVKVRAHQADDPTLPISDRLHAIGNGAADAAAKAGAMLHPRLANAEYDSIKFVCDVSRAVTRLAANLMEKWPRTNLEGVARVEPPPPAVKEPRPQHLWNWVGRFWQCYHCLGCKRSAQKPPPGHCSQILTVNPAGLRALEHRCIVIGFSDGGFAAVCQRCPAFATGGQLRRLAKACLGQPPARSEVFSRLGRRLHPDHKRVGATADLEDVAPL